MEDDDSRLEEALKMAEEARGMALASSILTLSLLEQIPVNFEELFGSMTNYYDLLNDQERDGIVTERTAQMRRVTMDRLMLWVQMQMKD